ncbi:MAG: rbsK [Planctomycetota bacterium]|nr:rbsK [Planctomycetota bacterium]
MAKVVVLGSSGFDLTVRLPRLPRPGETLLGGQLHTGPGGKGANQAIAARRAGADVIFLTALGDDDFGRRVAENDRAEGLDLSFAKTVLREANQVALIFVGEDGRNLIGVAPGASGHLLPEDIDALPDSVFAPPGVLLASLEVPPATVLRGLERARRSGMTTVVNPAPACPFASDPDFLALVDILTPNEEEAAMLTGVPADGAAGARRAARILRESGVRDVIVTLGEAGCLIITAQGERIIAAPSVTVVDTVGAGDAFSGALAVALAEDRTLHDAAGWACAAGAIAVTKTGAQGALPTRDQIDRLTRHHERIPLVV